MNIQTVAFIVGLVLGSLAILCACYVVVRGRTVGALGSLLVIAGIALVGLSVFGSIKIKVTAAGIELDALKEKVAEVAQASQEVSQEAEKISASAESNRQQLIILTNALRTQQPLTAEQVTAIQRLNSTQEPLNPVLLRNATNRLAEARKELAVVNK